ncbi:acrosin-like [Alligator mississippiensis]|uniref:acrosin-like n=1 Tax=Alligator mississippiensis TaxID=8496 RepID=UPI002877A7D1|nr:acrosin-like [Alligator mississippiensis]
MGLVALLLLLVLAGLGLGSDYPCGADCGTRPLAASYGNTRVVGGHDSMPGAWPWIVSIQALSTTGYVHFCGGSLIHPSWVVTAAHCFKSKSLFGRRAVIGATQLSRLGPQVQVRNYRQVVPHENYRRQGQLNDIALLELDEPVQCSEYIQLACVPDRTVDLTKLTNCWVSGWGYMKEKSGITADILQEAQVHYIDYVTCNSSTWYRGNIHSNNICAGHKKGGIDSCQGDSGGPLQCREETSNRFWLMGITSWGMGCARAQRPGIYTLARNYFDWIVANMKPAPRTETSPAPVSVSVPVQMAMPTSQSPYMQQLPPMPLPPVNQKPKPGTCPSGRSTNDDFFKRLNNFLKAVKEDKH